MLRGKPDSKKGVFFFDLILRRVPSLSIRDIPEEAFKAEFYTSIKDKPQEPAPEPPKNTEGAAWGREAAKHFSRHFVSGWASKKDPERLDAWMKALQDYSAKCPLGDRAGAERYFREKAFTYAARALPLVREQKPVTRAQQVERLEREIGDYYQIKQPPKKSFGWVVMEHIRGILTPKQIAKTKKTLSEIRKLDGKEQAKAVAQIWRENDLAVLKTPIETVRAQAQRASDAKKDVSAAIKKHLDTSPPKSLDAFDALIRSGKLVNQGSSHSDLRIADPSGKWLVGWTLDTPGAVVQKFPSGQIEPLLRNKFTENIQKGKDVGDNIVSQKKATQPSQWLDIVTPKNPEFWAEPGRVGATKETAGLFRFLAGGKLVYGAQKSDFHEYFLQVDSPRSLEKLSGRWSVQVISPDRELGKVPLKQFWIFNRPGEQQPYIFTHDFEKEREKAQKERVDLIWNRPAIGALRALDYFDKPDLRKALQEWEDSPRSEIPKEDALWFRTKRPPKTADLLKGVD
jgi:hypothetical protein